MTVNFDLQNIINLNSFKFDFKTFDNLDSLIVLINVEP